MYVYINFSFGNYLIEFAFCLQINSNFLPVHLHGWRWWLWVTVSCPHSVRDDAPNASDWAPSSRTHDHWPLQKKNDEICFHKYVVDGESQCVPSANP